MKCVAPLLCYFLPKNIISNLFELFFQQKTLPIPPCTTPQANAHDPSNCPLNQMRRYLRSSIPTPKHLPRHSMPVALATVAWNLPRLATECVAPLLLFLCCFLPKNIISNLFELFFQQKTLPIPPCTTPQANAHDPSNCPLNQMRRNTPLLCYFYPKYYFKFI